MPLHYSDSPPARTPGSQATDGPGRQAALSAVPARELDDLEQAYRTPVTIVPAVTRPLRRSSQVASRNRPKTTAKPAPQGSLPSPMIAALLNSPRAVPGQKRCLPAHAGKFSLTARRDPQHPEGLVGYRRAIAAVTTCGSGPCPPPAQGPPMWTGGSRSVRSTCLDHFPSLAEAA